MSIIQGKLRVTRSVDSVKMPVSGDVVVLRTLLLAPSPLLLE